MHQISIDTKVTTLPTASKLFQFVRARVRAGHSHEEFIG